MRACLTLAVALAAVVCSLASASAQDCNDCGRGHRCGRGHGCGAHGCHLHQHKYTEGKDRSFNCSCNGSYNYPVPPLYTYHWPGMYKAQRMTDYHSPWRFPPLKPFMDEAAIPAAPEAAGILGEEVPSDLQTISHLKPITGQGAQLVQPESMSTKLLRSFK
jgi:hypothetical protein